MRRNALILTGCLVLLLCACVPSAEPEISTDTGAAPTATSELPETPGLTDEAAPALEDDPSESGIEQTADLYLQIGGTTLTATLADNSSAAALRELLAEGPLTINMSDYGDFEKVGPLGADLPRNDEQITTSAGDIILYQGDKITIYYAANTWDFTRLGKIDGVTAEGLKEILGPGDVSVTLSLDGPSQ